MNGNRTISDQLKQRRLDLGLSLSKLARRAGTSAATLSRYEHGWTRFETYTLRKLALALNCDLEITLTPKVANKPPPRSAHEIVSRLDRLFWDHRLTPGDLESHPVWVVERVLEYGTLDDIEMLLGRMGRKNFLQAVASAHRVSPRTRNFWQNILKMEGIPCMRKYSRRTAWNS